MFGFLRRMAYRTVYGANHPEAMARSLEWPRVRADHLKHSPGCAVCGETKNVSVHHVKPFHVYPALELEPGNLITLCEGRWHHILFGHLLNWSAWNPDVRLDAANWREKIKRRRTKP